MFAEVDQQRLREKPNQRRLLFPTSIVTHVSSSSTSPPRRNVKQPGRPISSVFITQDPVRDFI